MTILILYGSRYKQRKKREIRVDTNSLYLILPCISKGSKSGSEYLKKAYLFCYKKMAHLLRKRTILNQTILYIVENLLQAYF